ncbi:hypothetical protein KPSA3_07414 [Pseudomonas syringae pv. actinidiae]|uniref:Uncharacterized protein n=1 Tax=Pseudomonas syringae pv. actinidiae TaxID=103796 RepID=A0AAN4QEA1_PSESF|nr:hypothetical protein KPSA3_07414 [Pseudomonas syringae pv. actinidiae]
MIDDFCTGFLNNGFDDGIAGHHLKRRHENRTSAVKSHR